VHRHLLWEPSRRYFDGFYVTHCLDILCEAKLLELLKALIKDDPDFPLLRQAAAAQEDSRCFFREALWAASLGARKRRFDAASAAYAGVSSQVLLLLAAPGATGPVSTMGGSAPLVQACAIDGINPGVVDRMIDHDPGALLRACRSTGRLPIHSALEWNPTAAFVPRMVELHPETLQAGDRRGLTPVMVAIQSRTLRCCTSAHAPPLAAAARVLADLVATFPNSVRLSPLNSQSFDNPLVDACQNFPRSPGLVKAVLAAGPAALCVPKGTGRNEWALPFEAIPPTSAAAAASPAAGRDLAAFLEDETLHLTLAAVEHALGEAVHEGHPATAFRARVREVLAALLLPPDSAHPWEGRSNYGVAQALRELPDRTEVCRTLFHHRQTAVNLYHEDFRTFMLDNPVVYGLHRLNRMGGRSDPSAIHQVRLLAAVKDDLTCLYVQLRECGAVHVLLQRRTATQEGITDVQGLVWVPKHTSSSVRILPYK
jgi:hypothetical protein